MCLDHIRNKGEAGTVEHVLNLPVLFLLTVPRQCFFCGSFLLFVFRVCFAILSYRFITALWSPVRKELISWLS